MVHITLIIENSKIGSKPFESGFDCDMVKWYLKCRKPFGRRAIALDSEPARIHMDRPVAIESFYNDRI